MDTSALVKLFIEELGSEAMLRFVNAEDDKNKFVSALASIEARSAIYRLRQGKSITAAEADMAVESLMGEMKRIIEQPVNPPVLEVAGALVDRHDLRALDAVQLASATIARGLVATEEMRFIASDRALLEAARKEGFEVWNPAGE